MIAIPKDATSKALQGKISVTAGGKSRCSPSRYVVLAVEGWLESNLGKHGDKYSRKQHVASSRNKGASSLKNDIRAPSTNG